MELPIPEREGKHPRNHNLGWCQFVAQQLVQQEPIEKPLRRFDRVAGRAGGGCLEVSDNLEGYRRTLGEFRRTLEETLFG